MEGKLSDQGLFTGHLDETTDGDVGMLFRAAFRGVPQSQWKELMQRIARSENFGGEVSNPQSPKSSRSAALRLLLRLHAGKILPVER